MKKSIIVVVCFLLLTALYSFDSQEFQTENIMVCKDVQYQADIILSTADAIEIPSLKNPAIENHVLKALEYLQECDLEHALNSVDALAAIVSQKKYENYHKNILYFATYKFREQIIYCYNKSCI